MTLHQKVSQIIGQWHGLDATERTLRRDELVSEVIAVIAQEALPTSAATAALVAATGGKPPKANAA
jgi:hypothetical protein